jgi:hypothetical protein
LSPIFFPSSRGTAKAVKTRRYLFHNNNPYRNDHLRLGILPSVSGIAANARQFSQNARQSSLRFTARIYKVATSIQAPKMSSNASFDLKATCEGSPGAQDYQCLPTSPTSETALFSSASQVGPMPPEVQEINLLTPSSPSHTSPAAPASPVLMSEDSSAEEDRE